MVLFVSQSLQVLVVALAVFAFFVVFGLLAIDDGVLDAWLGHPGHDVFSVTIAGVDVHPSHELLRVSTAIAALSGLYYAIAVLTDPTYREEFLDEVTGDMRLTFAARTEYLALAPGSSGAMRVTFLGTGHHGRADGAAPRRRRATTSPSWNRTAEKARPLAEHGARVAEDPAAAATGAEVVVTMLTDGERGRGRDGRGRARGGATARSGGRPRRSACRAPRRSWRWPRTTA